MANDLKKLFNLIENKNYSFFIIFLFFIFNSRSNRNWLNWSLYWTVLK